MKKIFSYFIMLLLSACSLYVNNKITTEKVVVEKKNEFMRSNISVDYPVAAEGELLKTLRRGIGMMIGEEYKGNYDDYNAFVDFYANDYFSRLEGFSSKENPPRYQASFDIAINKIAETDKFISYERDDYLYTGGAHGLPNCFVITFNKETGSPLENNFLKNTDDTQFKKLLKEGLIDYFTKYAENTYHLDNNEDILKFFLFEETDIDNLPLPNNQPYLTKDGVGFLYVHYEIAPYSSGKPNFIIPYKKISPYLSDEVRVLIP